MAGDTGRECASPWTLYPGTGVRRDLCCRSAFLGWTYLHAWFWQWEYTPVTITRALELGQQAVALDETLAQAHSLLGQVYLWKSHAFEQAIAAGERAIALAPNNADAYALLGFVFCFAGQPQDALRLAEQAVRLNP